MDRGPDRLHTVHGVARELDTTEQVMNDNNIWNALRSMILLNFLLWRETSN